MPTITITQGDFTATVNGDDGGDSVKHKKPRGRAPKGKKWDEITGRWIDATGSTNFDDKKVLKKETKKSKSTEIKKEKNIPEAMEVQHEQPIVMNSGGNSSDNTQIKRDEAQIKKQQALKGQKGNIKIVSWNVNGLNSILNKEVYEGKKFDDYLNNEGFDIICLSEIKLSTEADIRKVDNKILQNYKYRYFNHSKIKRGYSGTAVFSKIQPINVMYGIEGNNVDEEGRVLIMEFKQFYLVNVYVPNSGVDKKHPLKRLSYRVNEWDGSFRDYISKLSNKKSVIACGDFNVAHHPIDLKNPKTNLRTAGFTIEERNSFDLLLNAGKGLIDTFRYFYPNTIKYSFWSSRFGGVARKNNSGWRLDMALVSTSFINKVVESEILTDVYGSDHALLYLEIKTQ